MTCLRVVSAFLLPVVIMACSSEAPSRADRPSASPADLVSIEVTPADPSIPLGSTQGFTATGHYDDGSTLDLTTTVTWSSDTPSIATISNSSGSVGSLTRCMTRLSRYSSLPSSA